MTKFESMLVAIVAMIFLLSPVGCTMYESTLMAKGIAEGKDPLAVRCAYSPTATFCAVVAARQK